MLFLGYPICEDTSHHRHRVSEEDKIPFGKKVGLGTIICGAAIIAFSILSAINLYIENQLLVIVGTVVRVFTTKLIKS